MNQSAPLIQWPEPGAAVLWALAILFGSLVLLAFIIEWRRRGRVRRQRLRAEWQAFDDVLQQREASPAEAKLLKDIVKRHAPENPLRAVTVWQEFDRLVDAAMAEKSPDRDAAAYQSRGAQLREIRRMLGLERVPYGQPLQSTRGLDRGQWMSVSTADDEHAKPHRMVIEHVDEAYLYVVRAAVGDAAPVFKPGDPVRCRLWRDDDARYAFRSRVQGREDAPAQWHLAHAAEVERVQAREHYRVRFNQPTAVAVLNAPVGDDNTNAHARRPVTRIRGRITSLSAGGCALVLNQLVPRKVMLRINIEFEDGDAPLEVEARIIAVVPISGDRQLVRAEFVELDDETRDRIAKYVLQRQQHVTAAHEPVATQSNA